MLTQKAFTNLILSRYDHYSAKVIEKEVLALAGIEPRSKYEVKDINALAEAFAGLGDHKAAALAESLAKLSAAPSQSPARESKAAPTADDTATVNQPGAKNKKKSGKK